MGHEFFDKQQLWKIHSYTLFTYESGFKKVKIFEFFFYYFSTLRCEV